VTYLQDSVSFLQLTLAGITEIKDSGSATSDLVISLSPSIRIPTYVRKFSPTTIAEPSGFDGLEVECWLLVPKFAGSHPGEAVGFLGRNNIQHAFLRRGSKAVAPMS
jgi:hypothetical protein